MKTLEELKQITRVYDAFCTIEDSDMPEYYKGIFPKTCKCGAETIIMLRSNTLLQCCDPWCYIKQANRFVYFTTFLGFKGFGEERALTLYRELHPQFQYKTFLSIFLLPESEILKYTGEAFLAEFVNMKNELKTSGFNFIDAIASLGIPEVGPRSKIFDYIKSPVIFTQYLIKNKIYEMVSVCGIEDPKVAFNLEIFKVDILTLFIDIMPNVLTVPNKEINVAITGKVTVDGLRYSRAEFVALCNNIKDVQGELCFQMIQTKSESKLEYVIADEPSNSPKYELGQKLNILITAEEFYKMLKGMAGIKDG